MGKQAIKAFVVGLLLLSMSVLGFGQTKKMAPYKLHPEDQVTIQVFNQQQIMAVVPVGRDGTISAPFVGSVPAEGFTVDELQATLTLLYKTKLHLRDPIVSVTLTTLRQLRATIGGAIQRPGSVSIRPGDTVLTLYNNGGGEVPDQADLRRAYLRHPGSNEIIPLDLYAMTVLGDMSQNYELQDGDEITVPQQRNNRIVVTGALQRPGQYPYHEPMTLADAVALGGGEIRYRTMFSKTRILRQTPGQPGQYFTIMVDFVKFVRGGDSTQNPLLQPGDFIFVPESNSPDVNQIGAFFNIAYIINLLGGGNVFSHLFNG